MSDIVFSGHQPNFLPYMGFFYKMFQSDIFILDDDVQYSSKAWHNCNYIKVGGQKHKVTVPVSYEYGDRINQVKISYTKDWVPKFLTTIRMNYGKAPHFEEGYDLLDNHLFRQNWNLVDLTIPLLCDIHERFGLGCEIICASSMPTDKRNNDRNIWQCEQLGCNVYYSGEGGKAYNDEDAYRKHGIRIAYTDYQPVKYSQSGKGPFIENLSVIDYIFNCGFELPKEWVRR